MRAAAGLLVLCALVVALSFVPPAFADDESELESGDNAVNTQQLPDSSFIYDTSIVDLGSADSYFDGQTVQVTGEVIGDSIRAGLSGRHRWITLSSDDALATLSVYMSTESAAKIDTFGSYDTKGTMLQVRGTFHLVCSDHEGVSDLHAEVVTVVERGMHREDVFDVNTFIPGVVLVAVGLAMMGVFYWLRERQR